MDPTTLPNILTVGVIAGALAQMILFAWNALVPKFPMGAAEGAALTTILTAAAQWADRLSKREHAHVLTKYGPEHYGSSPPTPRDDTA